MITIVRLIAFMNTIIRMRKSMNTIVRMGDKIRNSPRYQKLEQKFNNTIELFRNLEVIVFLVAKLL